MNKQEQHVNEYTV